MVLTTILGFGFGVFPCILLGIILFLSFLICEFVEEYVSKHLCSWRNRRRNRYRDKTDSGSSTKPKGNSSKSTGRGSQQSPRAQTTTGTEYPVHESLGPVPSAPASNPFINNPNNPSLSESNNSTEPDLNDDPPPAYDACVPLSCNANAKSKHCKLD